MAKWKKRLRKGLKKAVPLLMAAGLAKSIMGRRKANQMSEMETVSDAQKTASQLGSAPKTPDTSWITKKAVADNSANNTMARVFIPHFSLSIFSSILFMSCLISVTSS